MASGQSSCLLVQSWEMVNMESESDTEGLCPHKGYSGLYYYNPDDFYF